MKIPLIGRTVGFAVLCMLPTGLWGLSSPAKIEEISQTPDCTEVFVNAAQSHDAAGKIHFYNDASILRSSSTQLPSVQVVHHQMAAEHMSCGSGPCSASRHSSPKLKALEFPALNSGNHLTVDASQPQYLTEQSYDKIDILPGAVAQLSHAKSVFNIKELILRNNSELSLADGTYWIEQLTLEARARIHVRKNARVQLYVKNPVKIAPDSSINDSGKPWQLFVYAMQDWTMRQRSSIHGFVYVQKKFTIQSGAKLFGGVSASVVRLKQASTIKWAPNLVKRVQVPGLCRGFMSVSSDTDRGDDVIGSSVTKPGMTQPDITQPKIDLNLDATAETNLAVGLLVGKVHDAHSNVRRIWLDINGATLQVPFDRKGNFQIKIPLVIGENSMRLHALDNAGNHASVDLNLKRIGVSEVIALNPPNQSILNQPQQLIRGVIQLSHSQQEPLILFEDRSIKCIPLDSTHLPHYSFETLATLKFGKNEFKLSWQDEQGMHHQTLVYDYQPDLEHIPSPEVHILTPSTGAYIADQKIQLKATIDSLAPPLVAEMWLDERLLKKMPVVPTKASGFILSEQVEIPSQEKHLMLTLKVVDALSQQSATTFDLYQDSTAPIITLDQAFSAWPAINEVPTSHLELSGTIRDSNLNSFSVNQQAIHLTAIDEDLYKFQSRIELGLNDQVPVVLQAIDASGNQSKQVFNVKSTQDLALTWVAPRLQGRYPIALPDREQEVTLKAMAVLSNDHFSGSFSATLTGPQGSESLIVERQSSLISTEFAVPSQPGTYQIVIIASSDQGGVVKLKQTFEGYDAQNLPVKVLAATPAINDKGVEPDAFITFQLNRSIDPKDLTIDVTQTAHGLSYIDTRKQQTKGGVSDKAVQFLFAKGHELQQVNFDRAPVHYNVSALPGDHSFAFYSKEVLAYNAKVFVSLKYQGNEISRYQFQTRPLPTFIEGSLFDVLGRPIAHAQVWLKELDRLATTNADGAFSFGYEDSLAQAIPGGSYQLVVNPKYRLNNLGSVNVEIEVEAGRRNLLNIIRLPSMDSSIAYQYIDWQAQQILLSSGELKLNLERATLLFPKGIERRMHVQFVPAQGIVSAVHHRFAPSWIYQIHPLGIEVSGSIGLEMKIPALRGGYSHVPDTSKNPYYVLILEYSAADRLIKPVGVAEIKGTSIYSLDTHPIPFTGLEAIGYFLPSKNDQAQIEKYLEGELNWFELIAELDH